MKCAPWFVVFPQVLLALVFVLAEPLLAAEADEARAESPEMLGTMTQLQHLSHKLQLALDKRNLTLAAFYTGEIGGVMQALYEIDSYGGYPVGDMAKSTLGPAYKSLAGAIKREDTALSREQFARFLGACNDCHDVTEHGYIRVAPNPVNPYLQSFEPQ